MEHRFQAACLSWGRWIVNLLLGGPIIAGATLSRFFALHVFVIPGLLIAFVGLHLLLVLKLGINEWPMPGRIVRRATYLQEYHELTHKEGVPFVPQAMWKDAVFSGFILLSIAACAVVSVPSVRAVSRTRRLFRPLRVPISFSCGCMRCFRYLPPSAETPILLIGPAIGIVGAAGATVCGGRRREELEAQTHCRSHDSADRGGAGNLDAI